MEDKMKDKNQFIVTMPSWVCSTLLREILKEAFKGKRVHVTTKW
jgi:hypothetical protein